LLLVSATWGWVKIEAVQTNRIHALFLRDTALQWNVS
jgi:hypothetical protein